MSEIPFSGVGVALVTLFDEAGNVDIDATVTHAETMVSLGMKALLVGGTTGEVSMLTDAERVDLMTAVVKRIENSALVIAGIGAKTTEDACRFAGIALDVGVGCLLSSPSLETSISDHYVAVSRAAVDVPVIAYHWPAKYPPGIEISELNQLPIAGCKDSTGDPKRLLNQITESSCPVYTGSSTLVLLCASVGGAGAILGVANAYPELAVAAFDGDGDAQRELHAVQADARTYSFPQNVKFLMSKRFGTSTAVR